MTDMQTEYSRFRGNLGTSTTPPMTDEQLEDAKAKRARAALRAAFAQGTDAQRAAANAATMGHGVNVIVDQCGVTREEAMILVLGRTFAKNSPVPLPAKHKRPADPSDLLDRAEAIAMARRHIAAKQVIGKIAP
jgi:hypothetical protein